MKRRGLWVGLSLVWSISVHAGTPAPAPTPVEAIGNTYRLVEELYQRRWKVNAVDCAARAQDISAALQVNPDSYAVLSVAADCAAATGDVATAQARVASLASRMERALAALPPDNSAFEKYSIPVLNEIDAYAFAHASGKTVRLAYYDVRNGFRGLALAMVLRDPLSGRESHYWFDTLSPLLAMIDDPDTRFPDMRAQHGRALLTLLAGRGGPAAAAIEYLEATDGESSDRIDAVERLAWQGNFLATMAFADACLARDSTLGCQARAVSVLQPWLMQENSYARLKLAGAHADGIGVARDPAKAHRWIADVDARRGDRDGTLEFATMRLPANNDRIDPLVREDVLELARAGNPLAQTLVANEIRVRDSTFRFPAPVMAGLRHAAASRLPAAQLLLGRALLYSGDVREGLTWLESAALAGDIAAQLELGEIYLDGDRGQARDAARGIHWLGRAALDSADPAVAEELGYEYWWHAAATPENRALAQRWLKIGADRGDEAASEWLAHLYEEGGPGIDGGREESIALYRWLAKRQPHAADVRHFLAVLLDTDPVANADEIARLRREAIEQGDGASQYWLGKALLLGRYGPSDPVAAAVWLRRAIANGEDRARSDYAWMLLDGVGVGKDVDAAFAQWKLAMKKDPAGSGNDMAWVMCASSDAADFRPREGLAHALRLPKDKANYLDTLAACRAANGDFEQAVAIQLDAIAALRARNPFGVERTLVQYQEHLAAYRGKRRFTRGATVARWIRDAAEARRRRMGAAPGAGSVDVETSHQR